MIYPTSDGIIFFGVDVKDTKKRNISTTTVC